VPKLGGDFAAGAGRHSPVEEDDIDAAVQFAHRLLSTVRDTRVTRLLQPDGVEIRKPAFVIDDEDDGSFTA
jgi:hypothetical protein